MTHRGPFQPLLFCDSVAYRKSANEHRVLFYFWPFYESLALFTCFSIYNPAGQTSVANTGTPISHHVSYSGEAPSLSPPALPHPPKPGQRAEGPC